MSVHLAMVGSSDRRLAAERAAKCRLRLSMIAMKEFSTYWPVCGWIFHLFAKIIRERRPAATSATRNADARGPNNLPIEANHRDGNPGTAHPVDSMFGDIADVANVFDEFIADMPDPSGFSPLFGLDLASLTDPMQFPSSISMFPHFAVNIA